jgi:hypothetical protein
MRVQNIRLRLGVLVAAAVTTALVAVSATTLRAAQLGNFNVGPRAPTMTMRSPSFNGGAGLRTEPRLQRLRDHTDQTVIDDDDPKGRGKGDGRHRPHKRPIHAVPVIGTGVAVGTGGPNGPAGASGGGSPPSGNALIYLPPAGEDRYANNEVVMEFAGNFQPPGILQVLRRNGLVQIESQFFTLTNSTVVRARITNGRTVPFVLQRLRGEGSVRTAQPSMIFRTSEDASAAATLISLQYAPTKLHLGEAHALADGDRVLVAVIDSSIDVDHPDLAGTFAGSYNALGKAAPPHQHGTAIAGAIAAHARLMGSAPAAKLIAILAFGASGASAEATTMSILKGIEYASVHKARIINMSFAGPNDPGLARALAAAKSKGAVLIAASGNLGPKSPPQYPAADANVIAVSATDSDDKMFVSSNIGPHISVSAPGVDLVLPSPGNEYRVISGTSFSAAYVSGVAALLLQRAPQLTPDQVRKILEETAKDLGPAGKDPQYGAGLVDAYNAVMAVPAASTASAVPPSTGAEQAKAQ